MIVNYAIGDVHGCIDLLNEMHSQIRQDVKDRYSPETDDITVIHLGDYCDRGPHSRKCIDAVMDYDDFPSISLKGNHEVALLQAMYNPVGFGRIWAGTEIWGGMETINDFVDDPFTSREACADWIVTANLFGIVGKRRIEWLRSLPEHHTSLLAHFVHAGVDPSLGGFSEQTTTSRLWTRNEEFLNMGITNTTLPVVHGHTIQEVAGIHGNRIGVDIGSFKTDKLASVVMDNSGRTDFISVKPIGIGIYTRERAS